MRETIILTFCFLALFTPNTFAECTWALWQSTWHRDTTLNDKPKKWEFVDAFQDKKECQEERTIAVDTFYSRQKNQLKNKIARLSELDEISKDSRPPLKKRFPDLQVEIAMARLAGKDDKEIESLMLQKIEAEKKSFVEISPKNGVVMVLSSNSVVLYEFKCIPDSIDPRI